MSETQQGKAVAPPPGRESSRPLREVATLGDMFNNNEFKSKLRNAVPKVLSMELMLSSLAGAIRKSPDLMKCSPLDVAAKALFLAQAGLPPDTPMQLAHLIPFEETYWEDRQEKKRMVCQVVIGYHGLLDLAFRSGKVASVIGRVAWRDEVDQRAFQFEFGTEEFLRHIPTGAMHDISPAAQAAGTAEMPAFCYAQATMTDGKARPFEVWPWQKVVGIRDATPAYRYARFRLDDAIKKGYRHPPAFLKAPWVAFTEKMGCKTLAKQLLNWLPRSVEYATIAALDDMQEHRSIDLGPIIDSGDYVSAAADAAEASGDPSTAFGTRGGDSTDPPQTKQTTDAGKPAETKPAETRQPTPRPPRARAAPTQQRQDNNGPPTDRGDDEAIDPPAATQQPHQQPTQQTETRPETLPQGGQQEPQDAGEFAAYVFDAAGEVASEAYTDPVDYAHALQHHVTNDRTIDVTAFLEFNAEGCAAARELSPVAEKLLDQLEASFGSAIRWTEPPIVTLREDRGRKDWIGFIKEVRLALKAVEALQLVEWNEKHLPIIKDGPRTQRIEYAGAVTERAAELLTGPPPGLAALVAATRPAAAPAAQTQTAAAPARTQEQVNADADKRTVDSWHSELEGLRTMPLVNNWQTTVFVSRALERMERETPEQYRRAIDMIEARKQALRGGP